MEKKTNAEEQKKKSTMLIKILVPAFIVIVVAGIFLFKNLPGEDTIDKGDTAHTAQNDVPEQKSEQPGADKIDVDFKSSEFDLDSTNSLNIEELLSYGLPVLIDFGADSCIPCKEMAPVLEELNKELRGKAIVKFVDVWKNNDAAGEVPLRVIPTQFFFDKDGKPYIVDESKFGFVMYKHKVTEEHVFTAHEGGMTKEEIMAIFKELGVE